MHKNTCVCVNASEQRDLQETNMPEQRDAQEHIQAKVVWVPKLENTFEKF